MFECSGFSPRREFAAALWRNLGRREQQEPNAIAPAAQFGGCGRRERQRPVETNSRRGGVSVRSESCAVCAASVNVNVIWVVLSATEGDLLGHFCSRRIVIESWLVGAGGSVVYICVLTRDRCSTRGCECAERVVCAMRGVCIGLYKIFVHSKASLH